MLLAETLFFASLLGVAYIYLGYPIANFFVLNHANHLNFS